MGLVGAVSARLGFYGRLPVPRQCSYALTNVATLAALKQALLDALP